MMRKGLLKKMVSTALIVSLIASVSGCGSKKQDTAPVTEASQASSQEQAADKAPEENGAAKHKIIVTRWVTTDDGSAFRELIDAFCEKHPDIEIEVQQTAWNNYFDQLNVNIAGGNMPDVIAMSTGVGSKYYMDAFEDLKPYMEKDADAVNVDKMVPGLMDSFTVDGVVYGIPTDLANWALVYNKDIFDAAGEAYPAADKPMTWDEFIALAGKFTKDGQVGYNDQNDLSGRMLFFTTTYGGNMYDALINPKKITIGEPEGRAAIEMLTRLSEVMPPVSEWGKQWEGGLLNGQAAMATDTTSSLSQYAKAGINFGVAPIPEGVPGAKVVGLGNSLMMSSSSKEKEAAWEFIKFVGSMEGQKIVCKNSIGMPIYPELQESPEFLDQFGDVDVTGFKYMSQYFEIQNILPDTTVKSFIKNELKNLAEGSITADEFIEKVSTEGQEMLDKLYK